MKNLLFILFFACFLSFSHNVIAHNSFDGQIILEVVFGKNAASTCTISIPDKYLGKDDNLVLPVEISFINSEGNEMAVIYSQNLICQLPALPPGIYSIKVEIGEYSVVKQIKV